LCFFAFFTHAITPPFAARQSDTEPGFSSEIKNRASVPLSPFRHCHGLLLSLGLSMHFARGCAVSQCGEASSIRQGDGQRFQKKSYENNTSHN
jgi:hypothetical protein